MAEDDDISRRYRELPREEPPRHLDGAIRAAARRAVHTRPAPLVVPTGRQRWYFPLAAAAIIVLAVAVTMHMEREQPGEEIVTAPAPPAASPSAPAETMRQEAAAEKPQPAPPPERARKAESPGSRELRAQRDAVPPAQDAVSNVQEPARAEAAPKPVPPPPSTDSGAAGMVLGRVETPSFPAPAPAPQGTLPPPPVVAAKPQAVIPPRASAELRRADEAARQSSALAKLADAPAPEQWLQGIADLRRQGRHEEADKALAEFRKRYPDYRISKEMRETVERNRAR